MGLNLCDVGNNYFYTLRVFIKYDNRDKAIIQKKINKLKNIESFSTIL